MGGLVNVGICNVVKLAQEGSITNGAAPSSLFNFMKTMNAPLPFLFLFKLT